jgi:hypothetical protein
MSLRKTKGAQVLITFLCVLIAAVLLLAFRHLWMPRVVVAKRAPAAESARTTAQSAPMATEHPGATPLLVELFTSEGCSDCPPADTLLAHLQQDQPVPSANIIALEEHVDYWDHLGWRDRFSSHDLTERQGAYTQRLHLDDNYTPQMIVDGTDQFVGSDSAHALRAVTSAARTPKVAITVSPISFSGSHANGTVSIGANRTAPANADLYAALVERTASTKVLRGENGGHTLRHVSTVLAMQKIGALRKAGLPLSFSVNIPQNDSPADLAVVVFAQQPGQGAILGVASSAMGYAH